MFLATVALYIFAFTLIMYLAYRVLWLVFFLFAFRFWHLIFHKFAPGMMAELTPIQEFLLLVIVAFITYLTVVVTTLRLPMIRYIFLAVLVIAAIRVYSLSDIFFFKDFLEENGMWSLEYWVNQVKKVFTLNHEQIWSMIKGVFKTFYDFFVKIAEIIRSI